MSIEHRDGALFVLPKLFWFGAGMAFWYWIWPPAMIAVGVIAAVRLFLAVS